MTDYSQYAPDIFLSYTHHDSQFVIQFWFALGQAGYLLWVDSAPIPHDAPDKIKDAILQSKIFVFVLSKDSFASVHNHLELKIARDLHKRVIVTQIGSSTLPQLQGTLEAHVKNQAENLDSATIEMMRDNLAYLSNVPTMVFAQNADPADFVEHVIQHIAYGQPEETMHTWLLIRAREWDKQRRNPHHLLRGQELFDALEWQNSYWETTMPTELQTAYINASQRKWRKHPFKKFLNRLGLMRDDNVFISYRRADTQAICRSIYDDLVQAFGKKTVFLDIDTIPHGTDFAEYISETLNKCSVFLAIIGHKWLDIRDDTGKRRLDDENDWVCLEVQSALRNPSITVIPVLVSPAPMPASSDLPDALKELTYRNGLTLNNDHRFAQDMKKLIEAVTKARRG